MKHGGILIGGYWAGTWGDAEGPVLVRLVPLASRAYSLQDLGQSETVSVVRDVYSWYEFSINKGGGKHTVHSFWLHESLVRGNPHLSIMDELTSNYRPVRGVEQ